MTFYPCTNHFPTTAKSGGNPGRIACMWRQTANCNATHGEREPDRDRLCSENVPLGNSGFCDCNGDNQKNRDLASVADAFFFVSAKIPLQTSNGNTSR